MYTLSRFCRPVLVSFPSSFLCRPRNFRDVVCVVSFLFSTLLPFPRIPHPVLYFQSVYRVCCCWRHPMSVVLHLPLHPLNIKIGRSVVRSVSRFPFNVCATR